MRYVVGLMMAGFLVAGVGLFVAGGFGLIRRFGARRRMRRVEGEIVWIDRRQVCTDYDMGRSTEYHYPEIRFNPHEGGETKFLSEIGAGSRTERYAVGQKIGVLYDPEGKVPPMIDSWEGKWGPHLVRTIVGPMLICVGVFLHWAFGDRIWGR